MPDDINVTVTDSTPINVTVTGASSGAAGLTGSVNGLNDNGTVVELGGTLTKDTVIDGAANAYNLTLQEINNLSFDADSDITLSCNSGGINFAADGGVEWDIGGNMQFPNGLAAGTPTSGAVGLDASQNLITYTPTTVTADNGLTKTGNNIQLGGLLTGDPNIDGNARAQSIAIHDVSNFEIYNVDDILIDCDGTFEMSGGELTATIDGNITFDAQGDELHLVAGAGMFLDGSGLYSFDSLPNAGTPVKTLGVDVSNQMVTFDGPSATTASNGLTESSGDISINGTLDQHTEIEGNGNTYDFSFTDMNTFVATANAITIDGSSQLTIGSGGGDILITNNGAVEFDNALSSQGNPDYNVGLEGGELVQVDPIKVFSFSIASPTASESISLGSISEYNQTIKEVRAHTLPSGTTVTFQLEERGKLTPNTTGPNIMTSSLVADDNQQSTTSFSNPGYLALSNLHLVTSAITGTPEQLVVMVRYSKN